MPLEAFGLILVLGAIAIGLLLLWHRSGEDETSTEAGGPTLNTRGPDPDPDDPLNGVH